MPSNDYTVQQITVEQLNVHDVWHTPENSYYVRAISEHPELTGHMLVELEDVDFDEDRKPFTVTALKNQPITAFVNPK